MAWQQKILNWYRENKRTLPWRKTKDPYKIWLSEVILQQTKVSYGVKYYKDFIIKFPTIHDLAKANQQTILKLWQGLGYYNRAINLHHTAKYISNNLDGNYPTQFDELIAKSKTQITLLEEKRQALITAAVTGKIDVRGTVA